MEPKILVERDGPLTLLTLNRPKKKNAVDPQLASEWIAALEQAAADDEVRAVVVHGSADTFCAGADVGIFLSLKDGPNPEVLSVNDLPRVIRDFPKPIFAAVLGKAVGMGVTMLPHFDLVYAGESATFLTPFVRLGLIQEFGSSAMLPRLIGRQRTAELLLGAEPLDAPTAAEWGLVARVFPDGEVLTELKRFARVVASHPAGAVAEAKRLLRAGEEAGYEASAKAEDEVLFQRYGGPENIAAVQAFLASRKK